MTPSFSQVATKVSNTTDKIASIRSHIDYRIKARHGIGDQLYKISNELQTIEKNMKKLVSFLQNSMDKYGDAEQKIARQVPMLPNVIGKNNITIDENGKIQVLNEYAQFNTDRPVDPNTGEYLFTYEGQRQVLGGNGSGTPDGLAQLGDLAYDFLFGDIETLFDPNASLSDKAIAAAFMLPIGKPLKAAKVAMDAVDNSKDIAKTVDKAEDIKNLSKSVDKTKEIQDKTISDLEVKQLGEYIKDIEKKQVDKGTGKVNLKNIDEFIDGTKTFDDVVDDFARLYSEKIQTNKTWSWNKSFHGGEYLTARQRKLIKEKAIADGLIPNVNVIKADGMRYGFADFKSVGLVVETKDLPESLWLKSDEAQFEWLDNVIGGRPEGMTWHHTEVPGKMELVPFGIHNITIHNGGRSTGMWADAPR
ncbi:HNH endonuclease [Lysinibacillus halotolerans]|uniref:HNH endonuclease signature motif containing protein n=1 Tax=Lysinibacillus halotolerans TaxID=1368476 RepID=UPI001F4DF841|nr:HNH endonuclease [Lysinibacillus halotolerans]